MNQFCRVLNIFFQKSFFASILSIAFTIATNAFDPRMLYRIKETGEIRYLVFLFISYFFIFYCINWLLKTIVDIINQSIKVDTEKKFSIEKLNKYISGLSSEEIVFIDSFMKTKNKKPYICYKHQVDSLGISKKLLKISSVKFDKEISQDNYIFDVSIMTHKLFSMDHKNDSWKRDLVQITLEDWFYADLVHSYKIHGRISHHD